MGYSRREEIEIDSLSPVARRILEVLESRGAQFFEDLLTQVGGLAAELERGLSELVSTGMASSDNFAGMRGLIGKKTGGQRYRQRRKSAGKSTLCNAGRWSLVPAAATPLESGVDSGTGDYGHGVDRWESVEYIARVLLKRYGIVFRKLLDNERSVPTWRDLQYVLRRMESRGEIRGGRFINGLAGEQFALPEAVGLLRKQERSGESSLVSISAADPLNLTGTVIPGPRVPGNRKNRLLFMNGRLAAKYVAGEIQWFVELEAQDQWQARQKLITVSGRLTGKYQHHHRPLVH
jgi:ATP-dependent Lhr-like helicase